MRIEPSDAVIGLTLRAWEPVFASIEQVLDTDVYQAFYPQQWQVCLKTVRSIAIKVA
jgi:hypothetical protein